MPSSLDRVPNTPLSGSELRQIIEKRVHEVLMRDGLFTQNIAFSRVSFEVRVSIHLDNPLYPEHISNVYSSIPSKQEVETLPQLGALEPPPLIEPTSDEEAVFSEELAETIASPNMARITNGLPIIVQKTNMDTGQIENKEIKYANAGGSPDPMSVGNLIRETSTVEDQRTKWKRPRKGKK